MSNRINTQRINIMTSCDEKLSMYILPQLASIGENLRGFDVHFYLAHSRLPENDIKILQAFAAGYRNLTFHEAKVTNTAFYDSLAKGGSNAGQWPGEAYYTLRVQDILPEDVDRVLYIDAGDVIIDGDISEYYYTDFEGNSIIATTLGFKANPVTGGPEPYTRDDILEVAKGRLFNSGSYVINVGKFRAEGYSIDDYLYLAGVLKENTAQGEAPYMGDQGFLAAAFVEDVRFFGYPEHKDPSYMPYNFRTSYWGLFEGGPDYKPVIIHYAIIAKPFVVRFSERYINKHIDTPGFIGRKENLAVNIPPLVCLTPQHFRIGEIWWKYAALTPIYEEANLRARVTADSWARHFLPVCKDFNDAAKAWKRQQESGRFE